MLAGMALFASACSSEATPTPETGEEISYQGPPESVSQIIGIGRVETEQDIIQLASQEGGIVRQLSVREGDMVTTGQVIIRLEQSVAAARLDQIRARIATQQAQVISDQKAVAEANARLTFLEKNLDRSQNLFAKNAETAQSLDNAQAEATVQRAAVERLTAATTVSRVRLDELKQELEIAERELALKTVTAPVDGQIITLTTTAGSAVRAQESFAELAPKGRRIVRCEVDELLADRVKPGQKAVVRQLGSNLILDEGEVIYCSPQLNKKSLFSETVGELEDRRVREVKILLDSDKLLLNARVECVIQL